MIRQLAILAVAAVCLTASTNAATISRADVEGQTELYNLMSHIYRNGTLTPEVETIVRNAYTATTLEEINHNYCSSTDPKWQAVVGKLFSRYKLGMLPRGRIFSVNYPYQLEEAILLFNAFYWAPTYGNLLCSIAWAYPRMNEQQFRYALSVAYLQRNDTQAMPLPPLTEIYPEFLFNTDVMKTVYDLKMDVCNGVYPSSEPQIVTANYSNWYITQMLDHEFNLTYYMEDVGISTWYHNYNNKLPFWMSGKEYPQISDQVRGEIYFYVHKMLLNRYHMERLSHNLKDVDYLDWRRPVMIGYYPSMTYQNGMHFPGRPEMNYVPIWKNQRLAKLEDFESRISEAVDSGFIFKADGTFENIRTREGLNKLADIIQGTNNSANSAYYGSVDRLSRNILGFSPQPHNYYQILPSALEHFTTSLRDPGFYRIYTNIMKHYYGYMEHLGPYTEQELAFNGVRFNSVSISGNKVTTYYQQVQFPIDYSSYIDNTGVHRFVDIRASQYRLDNQPFTYNFKIHANEATKATIRVFAVPKYNLYGNEFSKNYTRFFEIGYFVEDLKQGLHTYERQSTDIPWLTPRNCPKIKAFEKVLDEEEKSILFRCRFGFPYHLLFPKGKVEGMPFQFFFHVSKFVEDTQGIWAQFMPGRDNRPLGYPLDRPIFNFNMPNMYLLDTNIYHDDKYRTNLSTQ